VAAEARLVKPRTLSVLTVVVGLLAILVAADRPRAPVDADLRTRLVDGFAAAHVRELRLAAPGKPAIVLERRGDGFVLKQPVAAPADRAALQDLLGTLEYVSWRRRVPAGGAAEAKARGLDDASARSAAVTFDDGRTVRLRIGRSEAALERTWMNLAGSATDVLVDDYFARALDRGVDDLRRRDPLPVDASTTDVRLEAGAAHLVLRGAPPCVVLDASGACARADGERVAQLLRRLGDLRLARFVADAAAPAATPPTLHIVAAGHELSAFAACPGAPELVLVRSELGRGCVRADLIAAFVADSADALAWVDRTVLPYSARELRRVTMSRGATRLVLEREGGAWQRVLGAGAPRVPVDDDAFAGWWHDLASFAATQVVAAAPLPAPPAGAVTLELVADQGPPLLLWLAPATEKARVLVRRAGEPVALVVHADVARYFEPDAVQFAARDVLDFEASSLRELDVDRGGGVLEQASRGASLDDWTLAAPLVLAADPDALAALRDAAAHLHATRAVAAAPEAAHGLTPARLTLTFVVDPPPTTPEAAPRRLTLALGALTPQGECYARAGEGAPVFLLDAESCAALAAPLATREVWPERDAVAVEIAHGPRYERNGPGWYGPDGTRVADTTAAALVAALHALGAPATVLGYGLPSRATRLTVTWADDTRSTLLIGKDDYALEGRAVRYALPKEACAAFATLCR
jgi:hypothetical protein